MPDTLLTQLPPPPVPTTVLVEPDSALLLSNPTLEALRCANNNPPACRIVPCGAEDFAVEISPQIEGQTLILWDASKVIPPDAGELIAQIEFSRYDVEDVNAWTVVRPYALNIGIWQDPAQRIFGRNSNAFYRIAIRDAANTVYRSQAMRAGDWIPRNLRPAFNETIRRWQLRGRRGELRRGSILKRIRYGPRCTYCRDRDSGVQIISQCPYCYGTGWQRGYFRSQYCVYASLSPVEVTENFTTDQNFHSEGPQAKITLLNYPRLYPGDIWVEEATDHRWELGGILHGQTIGTVETITTVAAARLDFTNVAYQFQTSGQF